jgi:hypothetical protein
MPLLRSTHDTRRRAVVLLAVLVVVVLLSLAAYRYSDWMRAEYRAADSGLKAIQARALAESGVHYAAAMLADQGNTLTNPYDNASVFQAIEVPGSPRGGRFSVVAVRSPDDTDPTAFRYGVTDEGGKINLNSLLALDNGKGDTGKLILMALPNMTDDLADAILDWLDPDDTPRDNGAENTYYQGLNPPYSCKNGPLDSLEELLLVRGVTPQLLFGNDRNRNGTIGEGEADGEGQSDLGWAAYLTVYSREANVDAKGNARIYVNDPDENSLRDNLNGAIDPDLVEYIVNYRKYGPAPVTPGNARQGRGPRMARTARVARAPRGTSSGAMKVQIKSLFDLVNSTVNVPNGTGPGATSTPLASPLNDSGRLSQLLPDLLDKTTTSLSTDLPPRINVNTAPKVVLLGLLLANNQGASSQGASGQGASGQGAGSMTEADVDSILSKRPPLQGGGSSNPIYQTPAWLLTQANLSVDVVKQIAPYITARSQVYRVQSVGYFQKGGPVARVEAIIDTNQGRPRIVLMRNISELGRGFPVTDEQK